MTSSTLGTWGSGGSWGSGSSGGNCSAAVLLTAPASGDRSSVERLPSSRPACAVAGAGSNANAVAIVINTPTRAIRPRSAPRAINRSPPAVRAAISELPLLRTAPPRGRPASAGG